MTVRKKLLHNKHTDETEGFEDLMGIATEEFSISEMMEGRKHEIASELMVYWCTTFGLIKSSFPLGHFGISKPTAPLMHELWHGAISLATAHGLEPICGCCDGASCNERFIKDICTHSSNGHQFKDHYIDFHTRQKMFMMTCQTHLLKKLRNNLFRSGRTAKHHKRHLMHFDRESSTWQLMEWETLRLLHKEDRERFPILTRLTKDHLVGWWCSTDHHQLPVLCVLCTFCYALLTNVSQNLTHRSMMRGYLARDILSSEIAAVFTEKSRVACVRSVRSSYTILAVASHILRCHHCFVFGHGGDTNLLPTLPHS
jgi:hypothetical protein